MSRSGTPADWHRPADESSLWSALKRGSHVGVLVSLEPSRLALGNAAKQRVPPTRLVTREMLLGEREQ